MTQPDAWSPIQLREVNVTNRIWLSPMCQYSAGPSGEPNNWHLAHYTSRATAGLGMVMVECSGIAPDMRTTPHDLGLWDSGQTAAHTRLASAIRELGAVPAVQLGAAGRKSSHDVPWDNSGSRSPVPVERGGWIPLAPSAIGFADLTPPRQLEQSDLDRILADFARAARNADAAGYDVLELHGANGYLIHEFLSPLANERTDEWGGSLENRVRFPIAIVETVRSAWPEHKPLLVRLPADDLMEGGINPEDAIEVASAMVGAGVDMIDASSGVLVPLGPRNDAPLHNAQYGPGLRKSGALVCASGLFSEEGHLREAVPELVDAVFVGRALLRDPYWALRLRDEPVREVWPRQYHRAF